MLETAVFYGLDLPAEMLQDLMDPCERAYDRTIVTLKNPARSTDEEVYQAVIAYDPWDKARDACEKDPEQTAHLVAWV